MDKNKIIQYENLHCKVYWKYNSWFQNDFEIIKLKDVWREECFCYGVDQYIRYFIDTIKEKVIRYLPKLEKVNIILTTFDKNNLLQRLIISVTDNMIKLLNLKSRMIDHYKSVFVIIKYDDKIVFLGNLCFQGLI